MTGDVCNYKMIHIDRFCIGFATFKKVTPHWLCDYCINMSTYDNDNYRIITGETKEYHDLIISLCNSTVKHVITTYCGGIFHTVLEIISSGDSKIVRARVYDPHPIEIIRGTDEVFILPSTKAFITDDKVLLNTFATTI